MRITIIGYGFVGKALGNALTKHVELQKIDPKLNTSTKDIQRFKPEIIFICVPTPMDQDGGQDISILKQTISEIKSFKINTLVVVKSTILPIHVAEIENEIPSFVYNPEFLREKHANEDFINSKMIIFGGKKESCLKLSDFYKNFLICKSNEHTFTDPISASFVKYMVNSFLATKVIFFNEFYKLFETSDAKEDWISFIKILTKDDRLGSSHMDVPGHDGRLGFGGACFPKDSNAILKYANSLNTELSVLSAAIKTNNKIRASYGENTDREDEQNIFFNN
tara:strand:+ start:1011 stop:1850 length:840 start_codon:yes stop_codon:yes gene_type:complete